MTNFFGITLVLICISKAVCFIKKQRTELIYGKAIRILSVTCLVLGIETMISLL